MPRPSRNMVGCGKNDHFRLKSVLSQTNSPSATAPDTPRRWRRRARPCSRRRPPPPRRSRPRRRRRRRRSLPPLRKRRRKRRPRPRRRARSKPALLTAPARPPAFAEYFYSAPFVYSCLSPIGFVSAAWRPLCYD